MYALESITFAYVNGGFAEEKTLACFPPSLCVFFCVDGVEGRLTPGIEMTRLSVPGVSSYLGNGSPSSFAC